MNTESHRSSQNRTSEGSTWAATAHVRLSDDHQAHVGLRPRQEEGGKDARPPVLSARIHDSEADDRVQDGGRSCCAVVKMSKANRQDKATMNSSTSWRSASGAGATKASANKSSKVLLVLCSSSSHEESAQQAHMALDARA